MATQQDQTLDRLVERLAQQFSDRCSTGSVERVVEETYSSFRDAKIRSFLPILVERAARARLNLASARAY